MRVVPGWALVSAVAAPILLIGGWTLGAARQPGGFDQVTGTISALAAIGATDRWIMTLGLAGLGLCHCVTAAGLRPLAPAGRTMLAVGGLGTLAVAAFPLPAGGEGSVPHTLAAAVAFGALALWPALAPPPAEPTTGHPRRRAPWVALTVGLLLPVAWFVVEMAAGGERVGLAERVAAGAEALTPLLVVAGLRREGRPAAEAGAPTG
ncbi:DUF998 domain-containing protein [Micromonospora zingiberis]|uniref:DUF998 domain-containing protein n=1 Tax=Micromonospora zingiberis TaxID=2053011 RepID=A0A4R0G5E4_9ACTN|nr:DUF998 domain-containing protein [Micromonospora zingiberis]TCB90071.1 DUF998 domain-containing protein [Micromonospora zingiberis]